MADDGRKTPAARSRPTPSPDLGLEKPKSRRKGPKSKETFRFFLFPPPPETGAAKGMVVADSMGEWEWCWWQTTWENGKRQVGV
ncbi:uncharacterized protein [Gossypium hirsutum]|uniref:Uncharacterized protein isoform X2 n=1 Tax=Gossypium hirsutum TaxID=3635 RepID=A0ABM2ZS55_GOSHI|nr:uncharacterized protein LOC121215266 isoform X2 [Gossypium hirsutum]